MNLTLLIMVCPYGMQVVAQDTGNTHLTLIGNEQQKQPARICLRQDPISFEKCKCLYGVSYHMKEIRGEIDVNVVAGHTHSFTNAMNVVAGTPI